MDGCKAQTSSCLNQIEHTFLDRLGCVVFADELHEIQHVVALADLKAIRTAEHCRTHRKMNEVK